MCKIILNNNICNDNKEITLYFEINQKKETEMKQKDQIWISNQKCDIL